ncbi:MAG TPA: 4-hydroxybenzoate 3-monooxygenase [Solirubrobacteraceae bacterium]|nr:4-hydroxybenzoate 3-monooxygenase [Solirubrobacteraceae bacterium]
MAIIGAGPAGLLLGRLLARAGIEAVILEARSRDYVEARIRAGVLEQGTVDVLRAAGIAGRLDREGLRHGGIYLSFDGARHHLPMDELTGGRAVTVYGQTEVVKDLIADRVQAGLPLRFEVDGVRIDGFERGDGGRPRVRYIHEGREQELHADVIAGCDGFHGVCRQTVASGLRTWERSYPFAWLGILADAAPATEELIYARHPDGFSLYSMRSPTVSRLYLQVSPADSTENWSEDRIWSALHSRQDTEGFTVNEGPITECSITPMRSFVAAPMRHGNLFLAGDAAHIVPPTGAKGLNLAVADVTVLAQALEARVRAGDETALETYSDRCLARVWRAQHFSWWMTTMLHRDPAEDAYGAELALSQLRYVVSSRAQATALAENYVGLPLERTVPDPVPVAAEVAGG